MIPKVKFDAGRRNWFILLNLKESQQICPSDDAMQFSAEGVVRIEALLLVTSKTSPLSRKT